MTPTSTSRKQLRRRDRLRRSGFDYRAVLFIAGIWVLLWDRLSWGNLINGLILGSVLIMTLRMPEIAYRGRIHPWKFLVLVFHFFVDIVRASFYIARYALSRRGNPVGSIVEVRLPVPGEFYLTVTSALITLIPGSAVIETRRSEAVVYVHVFSGSTQADIDACHADVLRVFHRVVEAFGASDEIQQLRGAAP